VIMDIKFEELLCGFSKKIDLYGEQLNLTSTGYFNVGKHVIFKNKGMPIHKRAGGHGDLVVTFKVEYGEDDKIKKYNDVFLKIFKREAVVAQDGALII